MIDLFRKHPALTATGLVLAGVIVGGVAVTAIGVGRDDEGGASRAPSAGATSAPLEEASPTPSATRAPAAPATASDVCQDATVSVASADELTSALTDAAPGDVIQLEPGTYVGNFVASESGTADQPIALCGSADAVLDGDDVEKGYVMHLDGAEYWHLEGFTITNGQKGLMADGTVGSTITGLTVNHIGDEAVHLRDGSTDNVVSSNTISDTGNRKEKFGEGIYIGSSKNNWGEITGGDPDTSDRNVIEGNTISDTTAENIDIKEGTTGGVVRGNSFDGASLTEGDSWVDVKGNGWTIEGNTGTASSMDGFQTHELLEGWGTDNVFSGNTAAVDGPGFGFSLTPELGNRVMCDNTVSGAGEGDWNVECAR
ncbi:right-handed parallel beta-helix repeat-containing protein [Frigoribacterium sp. CFBP 8754]|uniref:right-handed parallel beta-helix repeat-containing protein n=1 Tax=unclassified Frigoribacterium TaxID=2627005 RepID=UPI001783639F|nr:MULTISPECIES: right-handed parallel beta-helix repeat-containing protein [unclassified Frigoribacterium]MBD8660209.1 right-handed parallel beta-helix repeat-containing protein [Frigoribacterium sp. CFBP 8754]MBD8726555.1 right-handed parallel beta-helix repeat-containing protein [Frigoribacterium sp. CFBP 13707]